MDDVRKIADLRAAVEKHTLAERECQRTKHSLAIHSARSVERPPVKAAAPEIRLLGKSCRQPAHI